MIDQKLAGSAPTPPEDPSLIGDPWRVLLVDDRAERRAVMRVVLGTVPPPGRTAVVITEASGVDGAVADVLRERVDAAIVEIQIPVDIGLAVIKALRATRPSLVIVVCSFHMNPATQLQASEAGADAYLAKPVSRRELLAACQTTGDR